MGLATLFGKLW